MDTDPDPDPSIFVLNLQDAKAYYFLKVHLHNFFKIKSHKEITKVTKQ
jgi:hypothetical protein